MLAKEMDAYISGGSAVRAMFEEGTRLAAIYGRENVYDFSLGNPNIPAPAALNDAIRAVLDEEESTFVHGYMTNAGYPDVRLAVAEDLNRRFGTAYTDANLLMTVGAAGGMNIILRTLLDPGDEVLVFAPYFSEYNFYVRGAGGVIRPIPADPATFQPDPEALRAAVTPRTKALIVNNPNNPTGVVYSEETLRAVASVLTERAEAVGHAIYIISDEPYRELVYDGAVVSWIPNLYPNTVVCYSWSKSLSIPGERLGYLCIPDACEDFPVIFDAAVVVSRALGFVNAPSLIQRAVKRVLSAQTDIAAYDRNRRALYDGLTALGFRTARPEGAFYLWVQTPGGDDVAFAAKAAEHRILTVRGSGFGCGGYVRLAYCVSHDMILRSMDAWKDLAKEYNLF
ncbi:MAG: pyridoxal phosphate-dependent aminotransferase [Oscillospiraceae bacterium]|nr:pyridoxal phosphate-dependent aminotransferase [Oscillospiraceae bacterium]